MTAIPQRDESHSKTVLTLTLIAIVLITFVVLIFLVLRPTLNPPPTPPVVAPNWIAPNSETQVSLIPGTGERVYAFGASATQPTLLSLRANQHGFTFAARVRDDSGATVATFENGLQVAAVALAPREGSYQLALSSTQSDISGMVIVAIGSAAAAQGNPPATILSKAAPPCQLTTNSANAVIIRSAPSTDYEVLAGLQVGSFLPVLGRTDDNWYAVNYNERQTWMAGDAVALVGSCDSVPRLINPTIPNAPVDPDVYLLEVDRDGSGLIRDALSTPQGDSNDIVWVRAINLYTQAPNNYREFTLTLNCTGIGAQYLRWGSPYEPTLGCGDTVTLPFLFDLNQQPLAVVFEANTPQSYVEYMLTINSAAAAAQPFVTDAAGAVG
jgi:hypothetical protein